MAPPQKPLDEFALASAATAAASYAREFVEGVPVETMRTLLGGQQHGSHFPGANAVESGGIYHIGNIAGDMYFGKISVELIPWWFFR
jgi:hypothetical protein